MSSCETPVSRAPQDEDGSMTMLFAAKHLVADFLTAIVFVAVYATTENLPLAIGVTIAAAAAQIGFAVVRKQRLDAMVWLSLFLAIAFGAAALVSHDPRFVMVKPSIIHGAIAIAMLRRGWMLRYMDDRSRTFVPESTAIAVGYGWAAFMIALGSANLIVALTASFATWAWFVSAGLLGAKLFGFLVTYLVFRFAATRRARAAAAASSAHDRIAARDISVAS